MKKWLKIWLDANPFDYLVSFLGGWLVGGVIAFIALWEGWIQNPWILLYSAIAGGVFWLIVGPILESKRREYIKKEFDY